jgi:hypothetical protein
VPAPTITGTVGAFDAADIVLTAAAPSAQPVGSLVPRATKEPTIIASSIPAATNDTATDALSLLAFFPRLATTTTLTGAHSLVR